MTASSTSGQLESVGEIQMYYEILGEGERLVLLHGFTSSGAEWRLICKELPAAYQ